MNEIAIVICNAVVHVCVFICLFVMRKEQKRIEDSNTAAVSKLAASIGSIAERISALEGEDEETGNSVEANLAKARTKIYNEWLDEIVNYNPFKKGDS